MKSKDMEAAVKTQEFTLYFKLPGDNADPKAWVDALVEAGCEDATVGVGRTGFIALDFARAAKTRSEAISSAIVDVKRAIPGCEPVPEMNDGVNPA